MSTCVTKLQAWYLRRLCQHDWQSVYLPRCVRPTHNGTGRGALDLLTCVDIDVGQGPCGLSAILTQDGGLFYPERFAWSDAGCAPCEERP